MALALLGSITAGACGGSSAPFVDPRPLGDGGIPDRIALEGGSDARKDGITDGAPDSDPDAPAGDDGASDAAGDGSGSGDAIADGGAADTSGDGASDSTGDAAVLATMVLVDITSPGEGALQVASQRFAPTVSVRVVTDPTRTDDVKQVDAELWSTATPPVRISSTRLAQLSRTGQGGAAPGPSGSSGGSAGGAGGAPGTTTGTGGMAGAAASGGGAGDGVGDRGGQGGDVAPTSPSVETLFSFGDTPVDLSSVGTDTYELRVTATTLAGVMASASRHLRIDAGPVIKVIAPLVGQAARGSIFVNVQVIDPFSSIPPVVTIKVANLPVTPLTVMGDLYQATVAETLALPPLSGEQLLDIGAVNAAGVPARHVSVKFVFDDVGPVITGGKPANGSLIGGVVKLEADIDDPAGVDVNTVVAVVAHGDSSFEVRLDQDPNDHKHFAHLFDTRHFSTTVLYPTISFRASDLPGNQSSIGYTVAVDNTPPLADLDPPADLRIRHYLNQNWRCSWQFDPLGLDAVSDGDAVLQLFDIRARVQDEGNRPAAGVADITPLAGLDTAHVELLVLDDTSRALVVDTDNDGVCDAVNPKLVPTTTPMSSQDALLVNLAPVPPVGSADLTYDDTFPPNGFPDCTIGNDSLHPPLLCKTSDLTIAIPSRYSAEAAVWTIPKVVTGTAQCVGNQFDSLGNHLSDGPACLAVHAIDRLGNSQVSRVLHVCIDHDGDGVECPYQPLSAVQGGTPVEITTLAPHGLTTGDRALVGAIPKLFDANGLWKVTVVSPTVFRLDGSSTPGNLITGGGQFMRWTASSDCTGRQTALNPVVVDDTTSCRPWRVFSRGEHLDID